jgi:hypothetical protein
LRKTINEIERAIAELPPEELARLRKWLDEFDAKAWDEQFERDAKLGKLDRFAEKAVAGIASGEIQGAVKHFAIASFWEFYDKLLPSIQKLVDKNFELLETNPKHPLCL